MDERRTHRELRNAKQRLIDTERAVSKANARGWECSSVIQHLPSVLEVPGSLPAYPP